jgi:hypothetical protein
MDAVALLTAEQRRDLFSETAARRNMQPVIAEKDFWVCWTLSRIFGHEQLSELLMFKGGTSLSKVFHIIERFSEDIDLILDWRLVSGEDPEAERSKSKQGKLNREINEKAQAYIAGELKDMVENVIEPVCSCTIDSSDPHVLNIYYPAAFSTTYLRPEIRLEIGPLASWFPSDQYPIHSYASEEFPHLFKQPDCNVKAIKAERTFWEKVTILHQEAHRPADKPQPLRYSRHYYDLALMTKSDVKLAALANIKQLQDVVKFKMRFYPSGWSRYETAKLGTLKLIPDAHVLASVRSDYVEMHTMIFGEYLPFDKIIATLRELENEINGMTL